MNIRAFNPSDVSKIKEVHKKYYQAEFDFPKFLSDFYCVFTIENNQKDIITVGGLRPIAEIIAITDKSITVKDRRFALYKLLEGCEFIARESKFDQIHCFIQDENWMKQLENVGFRKTKGQSLVMSI